MVVLFPGSFQWHQGLDIAIEAMSRIRGAVPNAELHLYGKGRMEGDLRQLAERLGLNGSVKFFPSVPLDQMPVWDPHQDSLGGNTRPALEASKVLLWRGHCSVHQMFTAQHVDMFRAKVPGIKILVHPECPMEVVDKADIQGSTGKIIRENDQTRIRVVEPSQIKVVEPGSK